MTTHSILAHPSGRSISVQQIDSNDYYIMVNTQGYEVIHTGSLKECNKMHEEMAPEMVELDIYE